jgi:hypothetical protein
MPNWFTENKEVCSFGCTKEPNIYDLERFIPAKLSTVFHQKGKYRIISPVFRTFIQENLQVPPSFRIFALFFKKLIHDQHNFSGWIDAEV